ncbi:DNA-binding transcriptional regulator, MarR family [Paenibacillus sp. UNC496MF]|uniref:MarR family winged helix-turn-helix transcriptional regulator n=1 Tax=Paenibacillus sp. UNC496MF TaxID=1502753 RepID=UPI0008ED93A0|nr:MarR family transcriptional regulator [Paenibacillus sp. UNC496MF]SFJ77321.1 DNA-binding transcriptional regulator, MarR family [Paenibacillus sp. UNC496MF]
MGVACIDPIILNELINEVLVKSTILSSDKSFVEGLTPRQAHIVMLLDKGSYRNGDLAARLGIEPSTLTRLLDPLVKNGVVSRNLNPDNRREILIQLTEHGLGMLQELHGKMLHVCNAVLEKVPNEDMDQVEAGIRALLYAFKQTTFHGI